MIVPRGGTKQHPSAYGTPAEMLGRGPRAAAPGTPQKAKSRIATNET
jgi:hypothetical protein